MLYSYMYYTTWIILLILRKVLKICRKTIKRPVAGIIKEMRMAEKLFQKIYKHLQKFIFLNLAKLTNYP